jgi:hypothetical protein
MYGVVASGLIFYLTRIFAGPPPKTMTREWQEATNEYLKVRFNPPPILTPAMTNTRNTEREGGTHHWSQLSRLRRPRHDPEQALWQEARGLGGRRRVKAISHRPSQDPFMLFAITSIWAKREYSVFTVGGD